MGRLKSLGHLSLCAHIAVYFGAYLVCSYLVFLGFSSASLVTLNQTDRAWTLSITVCDTPGGWGFFGIF